jgi:hypothetical protein
MLVLQSFWFPEPFMPDLRCRNDICITLEGDRTAPLREEYDLKIMALSAPANQQSLIVLPSPPNTTLFKQAADRIQLLLAQHSRKKEAALPNRDPSHAPPAPSFLLILSSGGVMERAMFQKLKNWRDWSPGSVSHSWMVSSVAISLAKARGRTFMM